MWTPFRVVLDRITAKQDRSPEAAMSGCGFSEQEIDAAEPVEIVEDEA